MSPTGNSAVLLPCGHSVFCLRILALILFLLSFDKNLERLIFSFSVLQMKKSRIKMLRDLLRVTQLPTSMWSQLQKVLLSALHTAFRAWRTGRQDRVHPSVTSSLVASVWRKLPTWGCFPGMGSGHAPGEESTGQNTGFLVRPIS